MSLERSKHGKRRHSLLTTKARSKSRYKLREKTRKAQGKPPEYQPTRIDEALKDKEAEG